jgi:hypothetical protein
MYTLSDGFGKSERLPASAISLEVYGDTKRDAGHGSVEEETVDAGPEP